MQKSNALSNAGLSKNIYIGIGLAALAALIWSGNFIIAKALNNKIPPFSLNFYRWLIASIIILPFAVKQFSSQWKLVKQSWQYLFWAALTGIVILTLLFISVLITLLPSILH
ncbi:MAG: EamA family transporter [Chitinophagaceae bacterium]|nr:EamA family transporter [Chitinophagaceae bacterium]